MKARSISPSIGLFIVLDKSKKRLCGMKYMLQSLFGLSCDAL